MGGKASLLLVLGFSIIFLVMGNNFRNLTTTAVDNFGDYYDSTMVYNIAVSGTNILANKFFVNQSMSDTSGSINFQGGIIDFSLTSITSSMKELEVNATYNKDKENEITKMVKITLRPGSFSYYAYFSENEGNIWWITGDTVDGPMHIQDDLQVSGSPVFIGGTSARDGITYYTSEDVDNPIFLGPWDPDEDRPLPIDGITYLDSVAQNGGKKIENEDTVYLTFQGDSINVKYGANEPDTTYLGTSYTSNGVILASGATMRLQGTVSGQYTVASMEGYVGPVYGTGCIRESWVCTRYRRGRCRRWEKQCVEWGQVVIQDSGYFGGEVFLDDDIVYQDDPDLNSNSTDILGIVAQHDIMVTDNLANRSNINIDASIYSQEGGFGAQNYSSRPISGTINLRGGIIQHQRRAVGTFSGSSPVSGFSKNYKYDQRLRILSPPDFPGTGSFQIVSWFE